MKKKYNKSFVVKSSYFQTETGKNIIRASPADNPSLIFNIEHDPKSNIINDFYPYAKWQYEAQIVYENFLANLNIKYALAVGVSSNVTFDNKSVPTYSDILKKHPETINLNFFIHLFGLPNKEVTETIVRLDSLLRSVNLKQIGFTVRFYNEAAYPSKVAETDFGFNILKDGNFEDAHKNDFLGLIKYRIMSSNKDSINTTQLLDLLIQKPYSMKFNFL